MCRLPIASSDLKDKDNYDSVLIVANDLDKDVSKLSELNEHYTNLKAVKELCADFEKDLTFTISNKKRLVTISKSYLCSIFK